MHEHALTHAQTRTHAHGRGIVVRGAAAPHSARLAFRRSLAAIPGSASAHAGARRHARDGDRIREQGDEDERGQPRRAVPTAAPSLAGAVPIPGPCRLRRGRAKAEAIESESVRDRRREQARPGTDEGTGEGRRRRSGRKGRARGTENAQRERYDFDAKIALQNLGQKRGFSGPSARRATKKVQNGEHYIALHSDVRLNRG